jgi:hypothetical protein
MTDARALGADEATFIAAVRSGDTARFALLTERHRRELQVHCYRMLANYEDAQDLTQETFLRYRLLNIAVLHVVDGKIAELTGFDATDKPWLGLPPTL